MADLEAFASTHLVPLPDLNKSSAKAGKGSSIEKTYQKKTQLEHILLRPDTYIGSVEPVTQSMWVFDSESEAMVQREITFVPGLYKIFDEILVNAADNKQRDPSMSCIKIDIQPEENVMKIWNNGKGIPVVEHKEEKMLVPTLIFGHLLTSSNFNDDEKKVTGGRNGYGAKLCNVFSTEFTLETSCKQYRKKFKQTWNSNMSKALDVRLSDAAPEDFTCITFKPDLKKFKMQKLTKDMVDLFTRRAYDVAASCPGIKVYLNGKRLGVKTFKDYVDLYLKDKTDDAGNPLKAVHEQINDRWEVAVTLSTDGFKQISFVNSIATTKGGRHVDYLADQIVKQLIEVVKKKQGKGGVQIKPSNLKNHLWLFCRCLVENPTFDSQTKEYMTLQQSMFGSKCDLGQKFIAKVGKCGVIEAVMNWVKFKTMQNLDKQCHKAKHSKLKGIAKLDDANLAGTKQSLECVLILTEGDSAKSLAVAGLGVVGRDRYGVFPLRGKLLNAREASFQQMMENSEINNLVKILGLQYSKKYNTQEDLKTLRYGKVMIMADQDQDGSHIKGLIINFLHYKWPELLRQNFIEEFITPIVKVFKNKQELAFFSLPEFEEWRNSTPNWHTWRVKYYKGLGTSSSAEAKDYFNDMVRHRIKFVYKGEEDDEAIKLAFGKSSDSRKEWLSTWMDERRRRIDLGLQETYLYEKDTCSISYSDFVNKELILFSNMDNERSIPSMIDGLKPGQRKVMFTCFKRNLTKEIKVAQLAGSVAELSSYHHGEMSLMGTIIGLAQDFVGSNNLNLLLPQGQFGTRLHGGRDAASPRYIFTSLSPLTRHVFNSADEPMLEFQRDDNLTIEPKWYMPVLPMVLVNGADGIGTGWSTKIPNFDVGDIIANLRRMLAGDEPKPMLPAFRGFRGKIRELDTNKYAIFGEIAVIDDNTVEITELPVKTWTQTYKESVLEPMLNGTEKQPAKIQDYKEYHTDTTVKFVVQMSADKLRDAEESGLHKFFKLQTSLTTSFMILFDQNDCIKRYNNVEEILREFFSLRLDWYEKRKLYLLGKLAADSLKLDNQARFIVDKIEKRLVIEDLTRAACVKLLQSSGFDSDPVRSWRANLASLANFSVADEADTSAATDDGPDYDYLLSLPMLSLTRERKDELLRQRDAKSAELTALRAKTPRTMWSEDLDSLQAAIDQLNKAEAERAEELAKKLTAAKLAASNAASNKARAAKSTRISVEHLPTPGARRIAPQIDEQMLARAKSASAATAAAGDKIEKSPRKQQQQKSTSANSFEFDDSDGEFGGAGPKPLWQRLSDSGVDVSCLVGKPSTSAAAGSNNSKRPTASAVKKEQATIKKSPKQQPSKKRKAADDSSDTSDDSLSSLSDDAEFKPAGQSTPVKKKITATTAKPKSKKITDSRKPTKQPAVKKAKTDNKPKSATTKKSTATTNKNSSKRNPWERGSDSDDSFVGGAGGGASDDDEIGASSGAARRRQPIDQVVALNQLLNMSIRIAKV
uniref:DNA topoisomerase 2 n=1 Tax=Macrostomum lignano TaxID=282301 RepID=A0A1I8HWP8_9PLAT